MPLVPASLAVRLNTAAGNAVLLLQAADPGAFVLLANDLAAQRDPDALPLQVDQHLIPITALGSGRLAAELADLRAIEQAVGAMIDQGWLPEQARQELHDRAYYARTAAPAVARQLLAALPRADAFTEPQTQPARQASA